MRRTVLLFLPLIAAGIASCASPAGEELPAVTVDPAPRVAPDIATAETSVADAASDLYGDADLASLSQSEWLLEEVLPARVAATSGAIPASFSADDGPAGRSRMTVLRLRDGRTMTGRVLSDDGESLELSLEMESGGTATTRLRYTDLHPRTVCARRSTLLAEEDSAGHLALGDYAAENGLFDIARVHYMHVGSLGDERSAAADERLMALIGTASRSELARARAAIDEGQRDGDRILARLQREFPGTPAAASAAEISAARAAENAAVAREAALNELFEPVDKLHAQAVEYTRKGLAESANSSRATAAFGSARQRVLQAEGRLDRIRKKNAADEQITASVAATAEALSTQFVANQIHLASVEMTRGNYAAAQRAVNEALARDASNREALALRARIETAAADARNEDERFRRYGDDYGYRRGFYRFGWRRYGYRGWRGVTLAAR